MPAGDFFITKHSNLADVNVVFHLIVDPKTNILNIFQQFSFTSSDNINSELHQDSPVLVGLRSLLAVAARYDVETVTFPILLLLDSEEAMISGSSSGIEQRSLAVIQSVKSFLMEKLSEDTKSIQLVLPNMPNVEQFQKKVQEMIAANFKLVENRYG